MIGIIVDNTLLPLSFCPLPGPPKYFIITSSYCGLSTESQKSISTLSLLPKLTKPKGDGLKRVTESGQRQKEVLSYIDKANKQMEDYKNKKFEAEFAAKAKMSEKKMYGGKQYVHTPTEDRGLAGPFKMKAKSPLMAKISASCKARAKKKFKVWPSAYASGWGVRCTQGKV